MVLKWSLESKPVLDKTAGPSQFHRKCLRERLVMANHTKAVFL